jgi:hypothetical protein
MGELSILDFTNRLGIDGEERFQRFETLPLMHQPGEKWMYHTGSDVLGVLIARASSSCSA